MNEVDILRAQWQACMAVRKSPEYRHFPPGVLKAEQDAFERMENRAKELEIWKP